MFDIKQISEKEMNLEMYYLEMVKEIIKISLLFNYKFHNRIHYNV